MTEKYLVKSTNCNSVSFFAFKWDQKATELISRPNILKNPGRNISQNFSEIIFDFLIFSFLRNSGRFFRFLQKVLDCLRKLQNKKFIFRVSSDFSKVIKKVSHFLQISRISSEPGEIEKLKILEKSQEPQI